MQGATNAAVDLSTMEFWSQPPQIRDESFAHLRREQPVSFHQPLDFGLAAIVPPEDARGFWALVTHEHVRQANRAADVFSSAGGIGIEDVPVELAAAVGGFLVMDGPRHHRLRRLVSSAFTPRNVARIEEQIADQARRVVDHLLEVGPCDFVEQVATPLPLWTISEMLGVPEADRDRLVQAANTVVATSDPDFVADVASALPALMGAHFELTTMAIAIAQDRRAAPRDDLMTALVQAEVDGERLTDEEIGAFMTLLAVAGNDTTRNSAAHAAVALDANPDQRAVLLADLDGALPLAVEEMVRWATPVMQFRRTALADVEVGGTAIAAGDKVVLFYCSANRDESVFADPWSFDVTRQPNDHLGFGGGGPHHCLGASLARTQLRCLYAELLGRAPELSVGEPEMLASHFINGIKRLPCEP